MGENAVYATAAAQELDNSRRLIERYIIGTDEDANRDPLIAPIEENPQRYQEFPYKLGSEVWATNYPIPLKPQFGLTEVDAYGQNGGGRRPSESLMEEVQAWPSSMPKEKEGFLGLFAIPPGLLYLPPPPLQGSHQVGRRPLSAPPSLRTDAHLPSYGASANAKCSHAADFQ